MIDFLFLIFIYPLEFFMESVLHIAFLTTQSYGVSIIFLSVIVNIFLLPIESLAEKYKLNHHEIREKLDDKIQYFKTHFSGKEQYFFIKTLYRQNNYHPILAVKASLGLLLQIPFFIAAYHLLNQYPAFNNVSFGAIDNLIKADGLLWGENLLPFLMTIFNLVSIHFYTRKMGSKGTLQLYVFAGLFFIFLYSESAALLLYWTVNNLFSLLKNSYKNYQIAPIKPLLKSTKIEFKASFKIFFISSFTIAFIILIVNPLILFNSSNDFTISTLNLMTYLTLFCVISLIIVNFIYFISFKWLQKFLTYLSVFLLVGIVFYSYLGQTDYGLLNYFIFTNPDNVLISNSDKKIEIFLLISFFVIFTKFYLHFQRYILKSVSIIALILITYTTLNFEIKQEVNNVYESSSAASEAEKNKLMAMSSEKNILLIFLDGFRGSVIENIINKQDSLLNEYDGFTLYPNTLSTGTRTLISIAAITGGHDYTVENINTRNTYTMQEEINNAYNTYPKYFLPHAYDITYVNPQYSTRIHPEVNVINEEAFIDEYKNSLPENSSLQTTSLENLVKRDIGTLLAISVFKISPYFFRPLIYDDGWWLGARNMLKESDDFTFFKSANIWGLLDSLANNLNNNSTKKTLKYILIEAPHPPMAIEVNNKLSSTSDSYTDVSRALILKISKILKQLKSLNIYDQTKIILFSDHGWSGSESERFSPDFNKEITATPKGTMSKGNIQPLLLIKDFGQKGKLKTSNRFMSNADVPSIVCSALKNNCLLSPTDPTKTLLNRKLIISSTAQTQNKTDIHFNIKTQYQVEDSIFNHKNWKKTIGSN